MPVQMPRFTNVGAQIRARRRESDTALQAAQARAGGGEKPWYEKYLLEPATNIAAKVAVGAIGEALSPAAAAGTAAQKAATALTKQKTGDLADTAMRSKFATYMQGWMRQNPTLKASDWTFGGYGGDLAPDLKAWAAKREPTGRR